MSDEQLSRGKKMLEEVALAYARDHGLDPEIEWVHEGYEYLLKMIDDRHTVRVVLSPAEIEFFAEDMPENRGTKMKIRNAFASLSM